MFGFMCDLWDLCQILEKYYFQVRFDQFGLSRLSVCDDGCRVATEEVARMQDQVTSGTLQRYCELDNVIRDMGDIERLKTYGFRGEAELAATKTVFREDEAAETRTSCAGMPGITVTADNLFCRLPVRRNYYRSTNRS